MWRHFQRAGGGSFADARPRLDYLLRWIARRSVAAPRVLNVGLGEGYFERQARERGWETHALDPDAEALARLAAEGVHVHAGRAEAMPLGDELFDFAVASEVLEHLDDGQRSHAVREFARVLKPRGWFLGTTPYGEDLRQGETVCPQCGEVFHRWGHAASFDLAAIRRELSPYFRVQQLRRTAFVDLWGRGATGFLKGAVRVVLARLGEPIAVPTLFWAARKESAG